MNLNEIFQSIAENMLSKFEHGQTQIKHLGERGREREAALSSFLSAYMPTRYAISTGEIVDTRGGVSRQCDLIIYDHFNCPLLLAGENVQIFPAESVLAVIEVKSVLKSKEIKDSVVKIQQLKNLHRENGPIPGIVFAYKSGWKQDPIIRTASELKRQNKSLHGHEYIDLVCVLSKGLITLDTVFDGFSLVSNDISDRCMLTFRELDIPVLLFFFTNLLDLLETQSYTKPIYQQYTKGMIGLVQKTSVVEN